MSINRWAKKRDASEAGIIRVLRQCGMSVKPIDQPVDLIVGFRRRTFLVECKSGDKGYAKALNKNQQDFADGWRGSEVVILRNEQEATEWCKEIANG